jgi:tRNA pseudouridine55 synthase
MTSHDAVEKLRGLPGIRKTGHAGTLDPMATGVLVVCVNEATKASRFFMEGEKEYVATLRLGVETDTQDATGAVIRRRDPVAVGRADLERAASGFVGEIAQVPPMFSAVKHAGVRLHVLARKNEEVTRAARRVRVHAIEVTDFAPPDVTLRIACSKGTYIRTLAADLGERLGCGAMLVSLRRVRSGAFGIDRAAPLETLLRGREAELGKRLLALTDALPDWTPLAADPAAAERARHGQLPDPPPGAVAGDRVKVLDPAGALVALAEVTAERSGRHRLRALRVFAAEG